MEKQFYNIFKFRLHSVVILLFAAVFFLSCEDDLTPSLYEDQPKGATPVVNSIDPAAGLAGVTMLTITGENFSAVPDNNYVYFNATRVPVVEASPTTLVIKAPNITGDDLQVKVAVFGVELFSNTISYSLEAAVAPIYEFADFEDPYAIAIDGTGNFYISLVVDNAGRGVWKLTPDGTFTEFAPKGGETFYNDLKVGPEGKLYGVRNVRAVFEITEGQSPAAIPVSQTSAKFVAIDFDADDNLWLGGEGGNIWRITLSDGSSKDFPFEPKISSMKVFDGYLYVTASSATESGVYKMQIVSADELGAPETVFKFSDHYTLGVDRMLSMTISADGEIFVGTNTDEVILLVKNDGSFEAFYEGLLAGPAINMTWGDDTNLYFTSQVIEGVQQQLIYRVNTERLGAPYYGRQ